MQKELLIEHSIQKLFDKGSSVLFRWNNDEHWSIDYVSENVYKLLGYTADEFMQNKIAYADCIEPSFLAKVQEEVIQNSQQKKEFFEHEPYKIITKDKQERWVLDQTVIERDKNGNITHYIGYINDITKTVELAQKNKELIDRIELAVESTNDGIWDWDIQSDKAYFSKQWKGMLGYSDEEVANTGKAFFALIHEDDKQKVEDALQQHFSDPKKPYSVEVRLKQKNGDYKWVLSRGSVIFDEESKPKRMLGSHIDISRQKEVEKKLEESEFRWKFAIDGSGDGLWDWNLQTSEVYFSKKWKEMLGFEENEIEGSLAEWTKRVNPKHLKRVYKDIQEYIDGKTDKYMNEHQVLCKDGTYKWVLDRGVIVERDKEGNPLRMIGTHTDIDQNKRQQEQLKRAQETAKIGIWELDHLTQKLSWSDEIYKIFDIDKKKFKPSYTAFIDVIHPDDRDEVNSAYAESLQTKEPYEITHRLLMHDKSVKYVREQCDTEFDEDGSPLLSRGTVQDITELSLLDAQLQKDRKRYKMLMELSSDGIFIVDKEMNLVEYSKVAKKMLGYTDAQMKKLKVTDWDMQIDKESLKGLISSLSDVPTTFETIHKRKDGSTYDASITSVLIDIDGEEYVYASVRDISNVKKLQDEILYERNFISAIIDNSNAVIAVIDAEGRMIKLNRFGENISGYTQKELSKEPLAWKCLLPLEIQDNIMAMLEDAKKGNIVESYQNAWISKSGERHLFEWSNTLIKKHDGSMDYIVSIGLDITQNEEQKSFLDMLINSQSHMIVLTDKYELKYINQPTLEFFESETIEELKAKYNCICETFEKENDYFYYSPDSKYQNWIDAIERVPKDKRIVSIYSKKQDKTKQFQVNIDNYTNNELYVVTLIDISETMQKQSELDYKSKHDQLTDAHNRVYFQEHYRSIINSYKDTNHKTAVAMLDIDHFKDVNDTYGHDIGDEVLKILVNLIKEHSRDNDVLIRWGGEEFLLMMPINKKQNLQKKLDSLRELVQNTKIDKIGNVTISIGASFHNEDESIESTIKRSDAALYNSKHNGRNLVTIS
jgi:diguanylate cyclase (GGDEF)-like protein/PAS domain S-box-containing protein